MKIFKITSITLALCVGSGCALVMPSPNKVSTAIMQECDTSRDLQISRQEAIICKNNDTLDELADQFDQHDSDKDGYVSKAELDSAIRGYMSKPDPSAV